MSKHEVTAIILAGGIGTHFLPFVTDKTLFPFMGVSLLSRTLHMFEKSSIASAIVVTNERNDQWLSQNKGTFPNLSITSLKQPKPIGMGDALLTVKHLLPRSGVLVTNAGDMVDETLVPGLLAMCKDKRAVVTGMEVESYQPLGYFKMRGDQATGIVEKPGPDAMPSNLANLVFHYFSDPIQFANLIEKYKQAATGNEDDIYEQALSELMRNEDVDVYSYQGPWQKLKFGHHVLDMMTFFLNQLNPSISEEAHIAKSATIKGNVVIARGARVSENAVIAGPAYIGENVIVGNNALVRESMIEEGSRIGFATEVARSYVGKDCDLHHAYVGDSVLEKDVRLAYGVHTANFRLDRKPIKLKLLKTSLDTGRTKLGALLGAGTNVGVNVSLMPGITTGQGCVIYPGKIVNAALADHQVVK